MDKDDRSVLPYDPTYKLISGALLGSVVGIMLDVVQRGPLCSAVVLSQIFSTHLEVAAPPILYVFVVFIVGVSLALFTESKAAHKTLIVAAGFTTLLQTSVPIPIPSPGVKNVSETSGNEVYGPSSIRDFIAVRQGEALILVTEDRRALRDILLRFDNLDWIEREWNTFFIDLKSEESRVAVDFSRILSPRQLVKYYYLTIEVSGYKIETVDFMARDRAADESIQHVVRVALKPTFVPLFIQRLFITPPSEQPIPTETPPV